MKNLSLKRIVSIVVVAAMLLAVLAVPALADTKVITIMHSNMYGDTNGVIAWSTSTDKTVEAIYSVDGAVTFQWWTHVLLTATGNENEYTVTATETNTTTYTTWTVGANTVVLSAHASATDTTSYNNLVALAVGDTLTLTGTIVDTYATNVSDVSFTVAAATGNESSEEAAASSEEAATSSEEEAGGDVEIDGSVITIAYANTYPAVGIIAWSTSEAKTADTIYAPDGAADAGNFLWWKHALLTPTANENEYTVTAVAGGDTTYTTWTTADGQVIISGHDSDADATSFANLAALEVGDTVELTGTVLDVYSAVTGVYFTNTTPVPVESSEEEVVESSEEVIESSEEAVESSEEVVESSEEAVESSEEAVESSVEAVESSEEAVESSDEVIDDSSDEEVGGAFDITAAMGTAKDNAQFDFVVTAPESYKAGDIISVVVSIKNITAEGGLGTVQAALKYDNTKLEITNDIDEDKDNVLVCLTTTPNDSVWENLCSVTFDWDDVNWVATPTNDGVVGLRATTTNLRPTNQATADDQLVFTLTFKALADATGDIYVYVPHADAFGATNTSADVVRCEANGSYVVIGEDTTVDESSEEVVESSEEVVESSEEESVDESSEEENIDTWMGAVKEDTKLDFVVDAPATYKAGEEITVTVTVKNITAEGGLGVVQALLKYDNTKFVLTNDIDEDADNVLVCLTSTPNDAVWENLCSVNFTFDDVEWVATPTNDGLVGLRAITTNLRPTNQATEDGQIVFTLTFKALADATGDAYFYVPNTVEGENVPFGATNTSTGIVPHNAKGSYVLVTEYVAPESSEEVVESSEEVIESSDEVIESSEEVVESSDEVVESSEEVVESSEEVVESSDEVVDSSDEVVDSSEEEVDEEIRITFDEVNRYVNNSQYNMIAWNSDGRWVSVGDRYADDPGSKTFQWLTKAYLEYNFETGKWIVTATEGAGEGMVEYETWPLEYGKMVIMAHTECALDNPDSYEALLNLQVGDEFWLVGNYDEVLIYAGYIDGYYLTNVEPENPWVPERGGEESDTESTPDESVDESIDESTGTVTPDAGDASSMIVFAIIAIVAIAGSAIVIRKRD